MLDQHRCYCCMPASSFESENRAAETAKLTRKAPGVLRQSSPRPPRRTHSLATEGCPQAKLAPGSSRRDTLPHSKPKPHDEEPDPIQSLCSPVEHSTLIPCTPPMESKPRKSPVTKDSLAHVNDTCSSSPRSRNPIRGPSSREHSPACPPTYLVVMHAQNMNARPRERKRGNVTLALFFTRTGPRGGVRDARWIRTSSLPETEKTQHSQHTALPHVACRKHRDQDSSFTSCLRQLRLPFSWGDSETMSWLTRAASPPQQQRHKHPRSDVKKVMRVALPVRGEYRRGACEWNRKRARVCDRETVNSTPWMGLGKTRVTLLLG